MVPVRDDVRPTLRRTSFTVLCLAISALFVAGILREAYENVFSGPVPARVTAVGIDARGQHRGDSLFTPLVMFSYTIGGVAYESGRYRAAGGPAVDRPTAERLVAPYYVGKPVSVFVRKGAPSSAFLRRETFWSNYVRLLILFVIWALLRYTVFSDKSLGIGPDSRARASSRRT